MKLQLYRTNVDDLLHQVFDEVKGKNMPFPKESIQYALTFSTGRFIRILIRWMNGNEQKSPEEMAAMMKDFISIYNYPNL